MINNTEDKITALYDLIQEAKSVPLSSDKCMIERDKALDMLDEISASLPDQFKQAATIVQSRDELISQARREAENILRNARAQAEELVAKEAIYLEARKRCEEMVQQTQVRIQELKNVANAYMDNALGQTENAIMNSLDQVRQTRAKFQSVVEPAPAAETEAPANAGDFDQEV